MTWIGNIGYQGVGQPILIPPPIEKPSPVSSPLIIADKPLFVVVHVHLDKYIFIDNVNI